YPVARICWSDDSAEPWSKSRAWPLATSAFASIRLIRRTIPPHWSANAALDPTRPPPPIIVTFIRHSLLDMRRRRRILAEPADGILQDLEHLRLLEDRIGLVAGTEVKDTPRAKFPHAPGPEPLAGVPGLLENNFVGRGDVERLVVHLGR